MRPLAELMRQVARRPVPRAIVPRSGGAFWFGDLLVVASWHQGWDHVSVTHQPPGAPTTRCPTWEEMERVRKVFFREDETAMQLHVPAADQVNIHPYCLHLWRPQKGSIPRPPKELVA